MAVGQQERGKPGNLIDCHAHLDMLPNADAAIAAAAEAGVSSIISVGIDPESSRKAVAFAHRYRQVYAAVGIHPHDAAAAGDEQLRLIAGLAEDDAVVAVGETGLDYYRDRAPREAQADCFRRHITLARKLELPLIVHSRDAESDTLALLQAEAGDSTIILHCFAMTSRVAECAARGYYMSVAGNVTFRNATALRDAVKTIPDSLLLTETDAPFLAPVPFRGKPNEPSLTGYILDEIATLRGTTVEELAPLVASNFRRAFALT